jgi:hypothetical protein
MSEVATDHLWVYWAVAGPSTLLVVTIVGTFAMFQKRKHERGLKEARRQAGKQAGYVV